MVGLTKARRAMWGWRGTATVCSVLAAATVALMALPGAAEALNDEVVAGSSAAATNASVPTDGIVVINRSITLPWQARVLAYASVDLYQSSGGSSSGFCR